MAEDISEDDDSPVETYAWKNKSLFKQYKFEYRYWKSKWKKQKWIRKQRDEEKKQKTSMFSNFEKLFKKRGGNTGFYILHLLRLNIGC